MKQERSIAFSDNRVPISLLFVFLGFCWNDIINYSIPTPLGSSVMAVDVIFLLSLTFALKDFVFFSKHRQLLLLPAILIVYMLAGLLLNGVKAMSDGRQYYHFLFLFLGFSYARRMDTASFIPTLEKILFSLALGSFLLFLVEIFIGHGFGLAIMSSEETDFGFLEDERGIRILGSTETFNLCLFVVYTYMFRKYKQSTTFLAFGLACFVAILITQNRTPIISAFLGFMLLHFLFFRIRKNKVHLLFVNASIILIGIVGVYLLDYYKILPLFSSIKSAMSIENDEIGTSKFRLLGALGALAVFFNHILFGEGLGRGWQIDFGFSTLNIPPHNQYASILAKFGIIGFICFLIWMGKCFGCIKQYGKSIGSNATLTRFALIIFLSQIPYGFGFDYHPFFPFFIGMLLTRVSLKNYEKAIDNNTNV